MTMDIRRSTHPDLLDELEASPPVPEPQANGNGRQRRGRRTSEPAVSEELPPTPLEAAGPTSDVPETEGSAEGAAHTPAEPTVPEWLDRLKASSDPKEMLALLTKNMPNEDLIKDEYLQGYIGNRIKWGIRDTLAEQERQRTEKQRSEAYERGDLYALGQMSAADLEAQRQALAEQSQAALNPYLQAITAFQSTLPEAVQRDVQGRTYAPGGTPTEGFAAYLQAVHESALRHGLEDEVRKREPALRKAELSTTVGSEQSPELDGGPAQAYREITDAQVAAMTLEEYDRYFDDKGRPKPGVRVRLERGIDIRAQQR